MSDKKTKLKLVNNEVVVASSKPKLYTREEVEELCRDAHHSGVRTQHPIESYEWDEIEQWIKENL